MKSMEILLCALAFYSPVNRVCKYNTVLIWVQFTVPLGLGRGYTA